MFASRQRGTLIAKGLKIVGSVTAEGLVEVNGQIDGELHCTSLVIARGAHVNGTVAAERVVVDGTVEGPIHGGDVILKSQAHVVGDIHHQSLAIESGAFFDGRSVQIRRNGQATEKLEAKSLKQIANPRETLSPDRAGRVCGSRLVSPTQLERGTWFSLDDYNLEIYFEAKPRVRLLTVGEVFAMSKDFVQIADDVISGVRLLREGAPDLMKAFGALATAATPSKAIDTKTKELMALAIGIAVHCDGCVAFHTKMAHQHGATREEVAETVALAIYMGGGPAAVYGGDALRAYDQFSSTKT